MPRLRPFRSAGLPDLQLSSSLDESMYNNFKEKHKAAVTSCMRPSIKNPIAEETFPYFAPSRPPPPRLAFKGQLAKAAAERTQAFSQNPERR